MNEEFRKLVNQLPGLLERLVSSPAVHRGNVGSLPRSGIYVFYERGEPIYAGRSDRMKKRILEHGRPSSRHNSATFAFNLAGEDAREKRIDVSMSRDQLQDDPAFAPLFSDAKQRVYGMSVRGVEIKDPIVQTLFEVYAHIALRTKYNDFETH